ncbi:pentatricopeptide repeat domain-containing protein [Stagonosporopsis vannaccii]|nr:pentatricopeptide repeat domain-containing protein [Stagonosporopsis vannaccii]
MLALRRFRCFLYSIPVAQTRALRTQPRPIPSYTKQWNPTLHSPLRPTESSNEPPKHDEPSQTTYEQSLVDDTDNLPPVEDRLSHDGDLVIRVKSRSYQTTHAIKKLQYLLNLANSKDELSPTLRAPLWAAYTLAMKRKVSLPQCLPERAWNILWRSQYMDSSDVSRRQVHLAKLDRAIVAARAPPIAGQIAYRIERKFMAGLQDQALDMWAASRGNFGTAPDYLDTGARLYALAGHPDQARSIMNHLLQLYPDWDTSLMMAVFRAYTSSGSERHIAKAKEIYHAMKGKIGNEATLEMYDSCMIGFLEARSLPDAKQVFQDMVRGGFLQTEVSEPQAESVIRRLNLLYSLGSDISGMSSIALDAIAVLPVAYHGHVFSDWMKSALVEKAPQAAAQILDLMIQRGYRPQTEDFNFLLRTLLRTKVPEDLLQAENIGWKMVEEARLSSIPPDRDPSGGRVKVIAERLQNGSVLDADPAASVPAASASTFALIMRHHASNSQWEHVDYLTRQLRLANVEVNSTLMNVLIENRAEKGQFREAWQVYKSLTDDPGRAEAVFPDGETIRILWRTLRMALSDPANREDPDLPTPRKLLRETVEWWTLVRRRPDAERFLRGLAAGNKGAITNLMLHSFSFAQDLSGSLVALHVLRQKFDIYPTRDAARTVLRQHAWEAMHNETDSVRIQFGLSNNRARNMQRLTHTYERLLSRRLRRLKITEETLQGYTPEQLGDLELNMISEFVRFVLLSHHSPEIVELLIQGAANATGVLHIPTGDINVFDMMDE